MSRPANRGARAAACALLSTFPAIAHHPGGVGNTGSAGPINTISASTLEAGHGVAGVVVEYARLNTLSDAALIGATASGNDGVHDLATLQSYALFGGYGVTADVMISFHLPYVRRTGIRAAEEDADTGDIEVQEHGGSDALGDLSILGQYRFFNDSVRHMEAALLLGFNAPTGSTDRRSRQGELLDAEFQPGSGAWGGQFGLAVTRRFGAWSLDANVLYEFTTEGTQRTDLGDLFMYNAAVSYRLTGLAGPVPMFHGGKPHASGDDGHSPDHLGDMTPAAPTLDLVLELNGQHHDTQVQRGLEDENSGGHTLMISPGLRLSYGQISGHASVAIPLVNDYNSIQPDNDWRLSTGLMIGF
jgi:hypothetical protein